MEPQSAAAAAADDLPDLEAGCAEQGREDGGAQAQPANAGEVEAGGLDLEQGHVEDEEEEGEQHGYYDEQDPRAALFGRGGANPDEPTLWIDYGLQANLRPRDQGLTQEQLLRSHDYSSLSLRCLFCRRRARGFARLEADKVKSDQASQKRWEADQLRVARGGPQALELDVATLAGGSVGKVPAGPQTTGAELRARVASLAKVPEREVALVMANTAAPLNDADVLAVEPAEVDRLRAAPPPHLHMLRVRRHYALSGGADGVLRLWDVNSGKCMETMEGHTKRVTCAAADASFHRGLSGSSDGTLRLWDLDAASCVETLRDYVGDFNCMSVDWESRRALGGLTNGTLAMWGLDEGICVQALHGGHVGPVQCVAVDWANHRALSGSCDGCVMLWDLEVGSRMPTQGHMAWVSDAAMDPTGRYAVSGSIDGMLRVWDLRTCGCVRSLKGEWGDIKCIAAHWDSAKVLSGAGGGALKLWDLGSGRLERTLDGPNGPPPPRRPMYMAVDRHEVKALGVDWSSGRALGGTAAGDMCLWSLETLEAQATWHAHEMEVKAVVLAEGH